MACRVVVSRVGSSWTTKAFGGPAALRQVLVGLSTQVSITVEKPASLPPIVMLTSVVLPLSADTWLSITSEVVAPAQAAKTNEAGERDAAHCSGYALVLRSQLPLAEM